MNWYIALGIKIFVVIILFSQYVWVVFGSVIGLIEGEKWVVVVGVVALLLSSVTIPIACWIFNL